MLPVIVNLPVTGSNSSALGPPPSVDLVAIGRRIRELRGFDITQVEFARRIGVVQSHLSALERGRTQPCAEVLLAISREFGKSVDWLLTGETAQKRTRKRR